MSFNFGGPVMSQTIADETAAQRENRDIEQMGTDDTYTAVVGGTVRDGSSGTLVQTASASAGGRKDRNYLERGTSSKRNDYEYVDYATGLSAISNEKSPTFDEAKANTGLWPF